MKNDATAKHASEGPRLDPAWRDALTLFDRDLRRRGAAERTRRAYGADLGQLAAWAGVRGIAPQDVDYRTLRRYAAHLSERRVAASTVARKLAATRQFFGSLVEHGRMGANPADLMPLPRRPARRPRDRRPQVGGHAPVLRLARRAWADGRQPGGPDAAAAPAREPAQGAARGRRVRAAGPHPRHHAAGAARSRAVRDRLR